MRPLVVLILVLLAIAAFVIGFFVLGDTGDRATAVGPGGATPSVQRPAEDAQPTAPEPIRETPPAAPVDPGTEDDVVAASTLSNTLVGVVLNDRNEPVPGATVKLSRDALMGESIANQWFIGREPSGEPPAVTTTDAKGRYVFRGIEPAKDYYLLSSHSDYSQVQEELVQVARQGESRAPDLVMRAGSRLTGYVMDIEGVPIANAKLHLDSAYMMSVDNVSPDRLTVTSDNTGLFEFKNINQGPRNLTCEAEGFGLQITHNIMFKGDASELLERQFRLAQGHPIAGRVFGPENEGVVGCKITALNYGNNTSSRGEAITLEDGQFQIDGLETGSYILLMEAKGYRQRRQNRVQSGDVNVQIEMIRQSSLTGRVYALGTNQAIQSFTCTLHRVNTAAGNPGQNQPLYETTGIKEKFEGATDGSFQLAGVDPGTFAIKVTARDFAPRMSEQFVVIEGQPTPPIQIGLSQGGSIRGRVVDPAGQPLAGVQVQTRDDEYAGAMFDEFMDGLIASRTTERKARTNDEGFYELKLLNPGKYRVVLEHPNYTTETVGGLLVGESKQTDAGSMALKSGGSVRGRVLDQAGKPLSRGWVRIFSTDGKSYQARTDTEGRYLIEHIVPGSYMLSATRSQSSGGDVFENLIEQQNSEQPINVVEGQTSNRDLNLGN